MKMISAIKFYKNIEKEKEKFKLVNGLFIVKYLRENLSQLVGDFEKAGSVFNRTTTNKIKLSGAYQLFHIRDRFILTNGLWKKLNIGFEEMPIEEILK